MSKKDKKEEGYLPRFPALHQSLVIDSRHGSRLEIIRDLKASDLFENIVEAKSIDDGLRIVDNHSVDACFIGPSLSLSKAATFLEHAAEHSFAKDCAFIALNSQGKEHSQALLDAGTHYVIELPCSKQRFAEGVVRGVIKANEGSPWAGILLNAEESNIDLFADDFSIFPGFANPPDSVTADPPSTKKVSKTAGVLLQHTSPGLHEILNRVDMVQFIVDEFGKPTKSTAAAIAKLAEEILAGTPLRAKTAEFKTFLEAALIEWFSDTKIYGQRDATDELKRKLKEYAG